MNQLHHTTNFINNRDEGPEDSRMNVSVHVRDHGKRHIVAVFFGNITTDCIPILRQACRNLAYEVQTDEHIRWVEATSDIVKYLTQFHIINEDIGDHRVVAYSISNGYNSHEFAYDIDIENTQELTDALRSRPSQHIAIVMEAPC